jgi:hypothetical protein
MKNLGKNKIVFAVFVIVAGYFLWTEHQAHVSMAIPYLPYLLILLCPLMHIFMHHGHGHGHENSPDVMKDNPDPASEDPDNVASSRTRSLPRSGDRHD